MSEFIYLFFWESGMSEINAPKLRLFKVSEYYYPIQLSDTSLCNISLSLYYLRRRRKMVNLVLNSTKIYVFYASVSKAARCMIWLDPQSIKLTCWPLILVHVSPSFGEIHQPRTNCNGQQNTFENYQ